MYQKNDSVQLEDPVGVGFAAGFVAALFLALLPISGRVRLGDSECPLLDPYRLPTPFEIGWIRYVIVSLLFTACYGIAVALLSWGVVRLIPWSWAKTSAKWIFLVLSLWGTMIVLRFVYKFERMPWP
jgi:hypothetical protein